MSSSDDQPGPGRNVLTPRVLAIAAAVVVLVVVVVVLLTRGGDDSPSTAGGGASPSASPGAGGSTLSASPGSSASPSSSGKSSSGGGTTSSGSPAPVLSVGKPVRAQFNQPAKPSASLVVSVTKVEKIQAKAEIPGEVSGPALRITVQVRNTTKKAVPIKSALSNLYYGADRTPATQMTHPGAKAFPESVPANGTGTGVVLYTVPPKDRGKVVLEVIIDAQMRRIEFSGNCTGAC